MQSFKTDFIRTAKVVVVALVLTFGVNYLFADTWTGPTGTPPTGNVAAPLNTSANAQTKTGGITLGTINDIAQTFPTTDLHVFGNTEVDDQLVSNAEQTNSLRVQGPVTIGGTANSTLYVQGAVQLASGAGSGKVLTSDSSGNATWQATNVSSVPGTIVMFNTGYSVYSNFSNMPAVDWTTVDTNVLSGGVIPRTATAVVLYAAGCQGGPDNSTVSYIHINQPGVTTAGLPFLDGRAAGGGDAVCVSNQAMFPLYSGDFSYKINARSLDNTVDNKGYGFNSGGYIVIVGYVK